MKNQNEIIGKMLIKGLEIDKYKTIMDSKDSISYDENIQKIYNSFYKVRRDQEWRKEYYLMFKETNNLDFETILKNIYNNKNMMIEENANCIEASFASKMLATIDCNKPILDENVLIQLNLKSEYDRINRLPDEIRISKLVELYEIIEKRFAEMLKEETIKQQIQAFRDVLPKEYQDFFEGKDLKILDFILWSTVNKNK